MSRVTLGGVVETGQGPRLLSSHPDPSVLFPHTPPPHAEQPCSWGWGAGRGGPSRAGRFVSWCFRDKGTGQTVLSKQLLQGSGLWVSPSPDHTGQGLELFSGVAAFYPQEGRNERPGALRFGDWGGSSGGLQTTCPGGQPLLGLSRVAGGIILLQGWNSDSGSAGWPLLVTAQRDAA